MKKSTLLTLAAGLLCLSVSAADVKQNASSISTQEINADALSVPYTISFDNENNLNGWTAISPADRQKFKFAPANSSPFYCQIPGVGSKMIYSADANPSKDSWLVSPAIYLEAGKTYNIKYTIAATRQQAATIGVFYGTEATTESLRKNPAIEMTGFMGAGFLQEDFKPLTCKITPATSDNYYIGLLEDSDKYTAGNFMVYDYSITVAASGAMPGEPGNFTATADADGALSVLLSATAPSVDAGGNELAELTALEFLRGNTVIKTIENPVKGETYTYTDTDPINGNNIYYVRAVNSLGSSNSVEASAKAGLEIPNKLIGLSALQTTPGKVKFIWEKPIGDIFGNAFTNPSLIKVKIVIYDGNTVVKTFEDLSGDEAILEIASETSTDQKFYSLSAYAVTTGGESLPIEIKGIPVGKPTDLPYSENFTGGTAQHPLYLSNNEKYTAKWSYMTQDDMGMARFMSTSGVGSTATIYSGLIAIPADSQEKLTFKYSSYSGNSSHTLTVLINNDGEWIEAENYDIDSPDYKEASIDLSAYAGKNIQYALRVKRGISGYYAAVPDIRIGETSGIDSVVTDETQGETIYYDIMGRRVDNPSSGKIYIKVTNGKASRILMR